MTGRGWHAPRSGIHHVAHFVPNLREVLDTMRAAGAAVALEACTATGTAFAMVDATRELGHMIEFYEPQADLLKFYRFVKRAADGWDGAEPLRLLETRAVHRAAFIHSGKHHGTHQR